ncbi:ADP-ribosylglycohydrolase family protein [Pedobacter duraquae]|uniref:ADP-ribosylglycohydrolase n=1 Tax=Pedobacter duraquae TaxID=425511 RepID=A0A4R6IQF9_9SPHI|nr:ADP-ribosylglycohydrolase family protein [Pedobacter duraquae]TDO24431.1 ADP-ribosylglycohydrolase [Pedobacter duraquae]
MMTSIKKTMLVVLAISCSLGAPKMLSAQQPSTGSVLRLTKTALQDKIKGGWAGQTVGVTLGGPYEFKFNGTFIQDYQPLTWNKESLKKAMTESPGLYDDIYMDFTFVHVLEKVGLDAPVDSFANAFAGAGYDLWFANQAARYNLLNGLKAPQSGHPEHNLHADAIDYQIEADYSGLMNPGMPNSASTINDKVGHIMNYGDGWYGGVFVGAMYSVAFTTNDVSTVVSEALKTIPKQSEFYKCINDVISWHKQYPKDWTMTWYELQKKWADDKVCPQGVFRAFNIDAKINAAYVVLGLLYGNGDFTKTLEISTRAGQDADCNPSTAGGVLGTILGYDHIPAYWKQGLKEIEDMNFSYTTMSLNAVYGISYKHALEMIKRNGGKVTDTGVEIKVQTPATVRFEESFPNVYPSEKTGISDKDGKGVSFSFEGTGFALLGQAMKLQKDAPDYVFEADLYIDNVKVETAKLPTAMRTRRHELFWKLNLPKGKHDVKMVIKNPNTAYKLRSEEYVTYTDQPYQAKY